MNNNYYLSLGAGFHQKPLIEAAQKIGLKVIGVDQNPTAPGMILCDLKIEESITNYRKILYKVNSLMLDGEIMGGYAASYGKALLSWSYLAEKLRVAGLPRPIAELLLDKYEVRKKLQNVVPAIKNFFQPGFLAGANPQSRKQLKKLKYPLIVKPRSGWAKSQVTEISSEEQLKSFFNSRRLESLNILPSSYILEEKISGDEITVCGFVQNFQFMLISITDKITSDTAPFIEIEHRFPSKHYELEKKIQEIHQDLTVALQITDTPIVSEWKVRGDRLYLVEISAQIPGEYIASFLIPRSLGYDYFGNLVKLTLGEPIDLLISIGKFKQGNIKFIPQKISKEEMKAIKENSEFCLVLNENPKAPPESNHDRYAVCGYIE